MCKKLRVLLFWACFLQLVAPGLREGGELPATTNHSQPFGWIGVNKWLSRLLTIFPRYCRRRERVKQHFASSTWCFCTCVGVSPGRGNCRTQSPSIHPSVLVSNTPLGYDFQVGVGYFKINSCGRRKVSEKSILSQSLIHYFCLNEELQRRKKLRDTS